MRKRKSNTEQSIDEIYQTIDTTDTSVDEPETEITEEEKTEENEKYDLNGLEVVLERIEAGLIGGLLIKNSNINKPLIKNGDIVHLRAYAKLLPKDIIFYKDHDDYFIRRIIKFEEDEIWCAGDNERYFRVIHKDNVIAKALGRTRGKKFLSFGLGKTGYRLYANWKSYFNGIRLANRVMTFDEEFNSESFELAMQNFEAQQAQQEKQAQATQAQAIQISSDIDLDSDLADFLNPDDLVKELQSSQYVEEEIYVDSEGNEISKEQYEALMSQSEDEEYSEEEIDEATQEAQTNQEQTPSEEALDTSNEETQEAQETEEAQDVQNTNEEVSADETQNDDSLDEALSEEEKTE